MQKEFPFLINCFGLRPPQNEPSLTCHACGGGEACFVCERWKMITDWLQLKLQF